VAYTLVSFHAHPDDEVLLTGGTLAKAAAEGHRVVLVVATSGEKGDTAAELGSGPGLGSRRERELRQSAAELGCARVVLLGYRDSGLSAAEASPEEEAAFSRLDPQEPAQRLAAILLEERADALTIYDPAGGYGHPDHRQVHTVGVLAARWAATPIVLEATLDRTLMLRLARLVNLIPGGLGRLQLAGFAQAYSAREAITHRVDVRAHTSVKRRAMRAHVSQASSDKGPRTLGMLLRLPQPVFRRLLGREWFVEHGRVGPAPGGDIFHTLRPAERAVRAADPDPTRMAVTRTPAQLRARAADERNS
jgi:LmbE family N-acetylglucosaminyl deacetylase